VQHIIEQLYATAAGRLGAYGYVLTGSQTAAEELVQAAIVKVFVKRRRLANVAAAESYVRTTMRHLYIDQIRREQQWRKAAPGQASPSQGPDAVAQVDGADAADRALAHLSPRSRAAVVLRYLDGLSVAEVAAAMGVSEGAVKRYLFEGRAALGPALGVTDDAEPDGTADVLVKGSRS